MEKIMRLLSLFLLFCISSWCNAGSPWTTIHEYSSIDRIMLDTTAAMVLGEVVAVNQVEEGNYLNKYANVRVSSYFKGPGMTEDTITVLHGIKLKKRGRGALDGPPLPWIKLEVGDKLFLVYNALSKANSDTIRGAFNFGNGYWSRVLSAQDSAWVQGFRTWSQAGKQTQSFVSDTIYYPPQTIVYSRKGPMYYSFKTFRVNEAKETQFHKPSVDVFFGSAGGVAPWIVTRFNSRGDTASMVEYDYARKHQVRGLVFYADSSNHVKRFWEMRSETDRVVLNYYPNGAKKEFHLESTGDGLRIHQEYNEDGVMTKNHIFYGEHSDDRFSILQSFNPNGTVKTQSINTPAASFYEERSPTGEEVKSFFPAHPKRTLKRTWGE